jgi:hypothetical protein
MAFEKKQNIFTYTLTGTTLTINESDGITAISLLLTAGAGSYQGTKRINGVVSNAISLVANQGVTITAEQSKYIDSLVIDASAGTIEIIAR